MAGRKISTQALERLKKKLLKRKKDLIGGIASRMDEVSNAGETRLTDLMDLASDSFDSELAMSLASQEREELVAIDEALGHMRDGTYGLCSTCGSSIGVRRLEVIPFSTLCIDCKREQEGGGNQDN